MYLVNFYLLGKKKFRTKIQNKVSSRRWILGSYQACIYLLKVDNKNAKTRFEICSKLEIKTPEWRRSVAFIVNFGLISHIVLVFLLLTLGM